MDHMMWTISYGYTSHGTCDMFHGRVSRHLIFSYHMVSFIWYDNVIRPHIIWSHIIWFHMTWFNIIWPHIIWAIWHGPTDHLVQAVSYNSISDEGSLRKFYLDIDKTRYIKTETKRFFEVELTPKQIFDDGKASQLIKENSIIFEETLR